MDGMSAAARLGFTAAALCPAMGNSAHSASSSGPPTALRCPHAVSTGGCRGGPRQSSAAVVTPCLCSSQRASGASVPCIIKQRHCSPSLFILVWLCGEQALEKPWWLAAVSAEDSGSLQIWPNPHTGLWPLGLLTWPLPTSPPYTGWIPALCKRTTVPSASALSPALPAFPHSRYLEHLHPNCCT